MPSHWTLIKAPLHLGHAFLLGLTFLFLLLGGITGCGKDFWWLTITYGETGLRSPEVWNIGGVKACQIGKQCVSGRPAHYGSMQVLLIWHIVSAALFLLLAIGIYWLTLRPPKNNLAVHWWTLLLPPTITIIPILTLISDILVRHSLSKKKDISKVDTKAAFWLSALAVVSAVLWALVIEWIRWISLKPKKSSRRRVEEKPKAKWDPWSLWPWGQQKGER